MVNKQTASGGRSTSNRQPNADITQKKTRQASEPEYAAASQPGPRQKTPQRPKTRAKNAPNRARKESAPAKPRQRVRPAIEKRPSLGQRLAQQHEIDQPHAARPGVLGSRCADKLPPWSDEVGALLLIVLGVVMFTALLNNDCRSRVGLQPVAYSAADFRLRGLSGFDDRGRRRRDPAAAEVRDHIRASAGRESSLSKRLLERSPPCCTCSPTTRKAARWLVRAAAAAIWAGRSHCVTSSLGHSISLLIFGALFIGGLIVVSGLRLRHLMLSYCVAAWALAGQYQPA